MTESAVEHQSIADRAMALMKTKMTRRHHVALEVCARCGICSESCHYHAGEPKVEHSPAFRAERLRRLLRWYRYPLLRPVAKLLAAERPTDENITSLIDSAFRDCTMCNRCRWNCPMGTDTGLIISLIREVGTELGLSPHTLTMMADTSISKAESVEFFIDIHRMGITSLEQKLRKMMDREDVEIPFEKKGAKKLLLTLPGGDGLTLGNAAVFETVGESWTLSLFDALNVGYFLHDPKRGQKIAESILAEAKELGCEEIIIPECGHSHYANKWLIPNWLGKEYPVKVRSIVELLAEYIEDGRLKLDPSQNDELYTYNDPCGLGRNGGVFEPARTVMRAACDNYVELTPNREENWCCGGGGGVVSVDEFEGVRRKSGLPKFKQVVTSDADVVVAPCENCRAQLEDLAEHHQGDYRVSPFIDMVVRAMGLNTE